MEHSVSSCLQPKTAFLMKMLHNQHMQHFSFDKQEKDTA